MKQQKATRNPRGIVKDKPIHMRLMPNELESAERMALKLGISKANLARQAFLKGFPLLSRPALSGDLSAGGDSSADLSLEAAA